jgi:diguanylate cyclase (GGDEF)-like protein
LFKNPPKRPNVFFLFGISLSAIFLVLTVGITLLMRERDAVRDQALLSLESVNRHIARTMTDDLQVLLMSLRWMKQRVLDGQEAIPNQRVMAATARSIPYLEAFAIIDHMGYPLLLANIGEGAVRGLMPLHHFGHQAMTRGKADYTISSPWQAPGDLSKLFAISLAIENDHNRTGQSVMAILNVEMLEYLAKKNSPNHHWGVTIGSADGFVYTGAPFPHEEHDYRRDHPGGESAGQAFYGRSERLFFETDIDGGVFHINIHRDLSDIFAAWTKLAYQGAALMSVLSLGILIIFALVWRSSRLRWKDHLANLRAQRTSARLANLDRLTGLGNRARFDMNFDAALAFGDRISLLLVDIDRLKSYNQTYGRKAGDIALQLVARAVQEAATEAGGSAARYDSDLIALLVPGTGQTEALLLADQIRASVVNLRIRHAGVPGKKLSVSIAVATAEEQQGRFLLSRAFARLAEARPSGNLVIGEPYQPITKVG